MTPAPQHRFLLLDGMRGVAALGVLAFHVTVSATSDFQQLASFYLFVDFFFVLSGFVLWPSMPQHSKQLGRTSGLFILKRVFRFWPLAITSLIVALIAIDWERNVLVAKDNFNAPYGSLAGLSADERVHILVIAFLLLQVLLASAIAINVPLWSLSAEWIANVIYAPLTAVKWGMGIILAIIAGYVMLWYGLTSDASFIEYSGPIRGFEAVGRAFLGFGLGLLLRKYLTQLSRFRNWWMLVISVGLVVSLFFIEDAWHWDSYRYNITYFAAPIFALLILQLTQFEVTPGTRKAKVLSFMGVYSFGVYVFHQPLIQWTNIVLGTPSGAYPPGKWVYFFLVESVSITIVSILFTLIARTLVEAPLQRIGKRLIQKASSKLSA
ncbi:peptidoglycan/LPS O-acetylase OafA/YrhL [Aurantimicrobium minutum]|uniref:acyltransferase family protein n=1 Tax=Aurantimicrobium minutum TaxID=708131 RepID=UPI0024742165|nr:acyltransferase [Aurantimicrobium minutum]MDH6410219.1 peptidoglycan/LPS O-acetylase OafA/YrhL [Aurantimicrobium minutum]MDH6424418.1 peptidoglycan/LPS O-acetylase OafA/YrhL [Aurantimicrobium minutum]